MKKIILFKKLSQLNLKANTNYYPGKLSSITRQDSPNLSQEGFTLIEMIVVVVVVAILAAIAVPSWTNFINQRRANVANEAVLQALQQAQSEAKKNKRDYSVSFRTTSQIPQVAIYLSGNTPFWQNLAKESSIRPGQVLLGTNITTANTAGTSTTYGLTTPQTITFNYIGAPNINNSVVEVGIPRTSAYTQVLGSTRRCVKILTLLGSMQTQQKSKCNP